jgi:hypothetical protein
MSWTLINIIVGKQVTVTQAGNFNIYTLTLVFQYMKQKLGWGLEEMK